MNLTPIMPSAKEFSEFSAFQVTRDIVTKKGEVRVEGMPDGRTHITLAVLAAKRVEAFRLADGARLEVEVAVCSDKQLAVKQFHKEPIRAAAIPVEQVMGTRSGRQIGDESFHRKTGRLGRLRKSELSGNSDNSDNKVLQAPSRPVGKPQLPQSGYKINARTGRAIVKVHLSLAQQRDSNGEIIRDEEGEPKRNKLSIKDIAFVEDLAATTLDKLEKLGYTKDPGK